MGRAALRAIGRPRYGRLVSLAPYIVAGVILVTLPPFIPPYFRSMLVKVLIFAIFAMSLDLLLGYTGLPSLGHAAYFGVAGYTTAILMLNYGIESFWLVAPAAILMAVLIASIFGFIALRVSGIYFLLVTLALGELLFWVAWVWRSMTGGDDGLVGRMVPELGLPWFSWNPVYFYYFVFLAFVICFLIMRWIVNSPFGRALRGIAGNELRMRCIGYNTWAFKYVVFILGALFAAVAGMLFVYFNGFAVPGNLGVFTSGLAMFIVILGGSGTLFGSLIGAGVVLLLEHFSSLYFPERWPLILGAAFVITAMYARGGIAPHLVRFWDKVRD